MERLVRTERGTKSPAAFTQSKVQVFGWMMLLIYWHSYYKHDALALFLLLILLLSSLSHRRCYLFLQFFLRCLLFHLLQPFHGVKLGFLGCWCFVPGCRLWPVTIVPISSSIIASVPSRACLGAAWGTGPFPLVLATWGAVQRLLAQGQGGRRFQRHLAGAVSIVAPWSLCSPKPGLGSC